MESYYGVLKYTHGTKDWKVFLEIECISLAQARSIESHIKRMKNKNYIQNMKKYPEIIDNLLRIYFKEQD